MGETGESRTEGRAESRTESRTWKVVLAYDGTEFHGWQVQPERKTVQGELRAAIERVTGENPLPQGSGRTDAGVHALGQVASFTLLAPIPEANFIHALNRTLPASIRVLSTKIEREDFHARHHASSKTYEYRIFRGAICPPWLARYAYALNTPLDVEAMGRAAERILGEHDFTSFAARDPERDAGRMEDPGSRADIAAGPEPEPRADERAGNPPIGKPRMGNRRTIYESEWRIAAPDLSHLAVSGAGPSAGSYPSFSSGANHTSGEWLLYRVRGDGFLHHMVRNLVGVFLEVGRGNLRETEISLILQARARSAARATAPARGLFLVEVEYSAPA